MIRILRSLPFLLTAIYASASHCYAHDLNRPPPHVVEFLNLNCYECHNDVDKEGELDLESLIFDPAKSSNMKLWSLIHDRVRDGEMPPKEEFELQPQERGDFLFLLGRTLHDISMERQKNYGRVQSRRLNRIEYENTIHELLGVDIPLIELLPEDPISGGFSNIAESQQVSYHLLQKYLEAIDLTLDEAFSRAIDPPSLAVEPLSMELRPIEIVNEFPTIFFYEGKKIFLTKDGKTYRYTDGEFVDTGSTLDLKGTLARNIEIAETLSEVPYKRVLGANELGVGAERILNERQAIYQDGHLVSFPTTQGFHGRMAGTEVPETGWYRIRFEAKAHNPPEGRNVWGRMHTGILRAKAPAVFWVGKFEATKELKEYVFDAWIRKDHILGIQPIDKTLDWVSSQAIQNLSVFKDGSTGIAVKKLEIERIYPGLETQDLQNQLFGDLAIRDYELLSRQPERDLKRLLAAFSPRAFRRPVSASELKPYYAFAKQELMETDSLLNAVKAGYRAILCSHRFVYLNENPGKLDDYEIASRLSYFLWSSSPDERLLAIAKRKELLKPEVLHAQVERMLNDPRAEAFVHNFTDSWLELRDIGFTTPDVDLYPEFDNILMYSMLDETHAFIDQMIENDLSVTNVIDSNFAMLNERLAKHYGIDRFDGVGVQKVVLKEADRRGGIISQASVLKVTANGTTTSPIVRGIWLLERILGQHIPPPPDQVPAIEPDIRGAVSIRDQLDKHRSTKSCMVCHKKIDPPGFALENYDVIGGWRQNYRAIESGKKWTEGPAVDASYHKEDGETFVDIDGFKRIALKDPELVARNVLNQVLTYATGATVTFADRSEIDQMIDALAEDNYGFRSLIHAAVQSDIFLSK